MNNERATKSVIEIDKDRKGQESFKNYTRHFFFNFYYIFCGDFSSTEKMEMEIFQLFLPSTSSIEIKCVVTHTELGTRGLCELKELCVEIYI